MGLFGRKNKKHSLFSRLTDLALVAGTVAAIARRQGWLGEDKAKFLGTKSADMSLPQLVVVGSASLRLLRWFRGRKK